MHDPCQRAACRHQHRCALTATAGTVPLRPRGIAAAVARFVRRQQEVLIACSIERMRARAADRMERVAELLQSIEEHIASQGLRIRDLFRLMDKDHSAGGSRHSVFGVMEQSARPAATQSDILLKYFKKPVLEKMLLMHAQMSAILLPDFIPCDQGQSCKPFKAVLLMFCSFCCTLRPVA